MNKYQEALDRIVSTIIEEEADGYWEPRTAGDFCWESRNILQELVDKETLKKPIDIEFGPCGDLMLCCPTCKHGVVPIPTYHGNRYYPRCPFCGQLLKGEEENE
jgi:hypothetical protein